MGFQCLVAGTATEALALAKEYRPSAIVLDIGLPDHSGLSVLDRLKHDARTRHIPVHVVSASDHAQTALSLGAVGYMFKPVKREELADVLRKLETQLAQRMRRVLIVEDDPVQRDAVNRLLGSHDVETVGAGTAAECLELLKDRPSTAWCSTCRCRTPPAIRCSRPSAGRMRTPFRPSSSIRAAISRPRKSNGFGAIRIDHHQRREVARAAARRGHAVSASGRFRSASRTATDDREGAQPRRVLEGRRILIVEDDVRNVFSLTSILEPRGHRCRSPGTARRRSRRWKNRSGRQPIDLVLMDVMMPIWTV